MRHYKPEPPAFLEDFNARFSKEPLQQRTRAIMRIRRTCPDSAPKSGRWASKPKRFGKTENAKASLSKHPEAAARRLKRAIAWHKRVKDEERANKFG